jgi:putative spermidine/putrescine transport system permease protein
VTGWLRREAVGVLLVIALTIWIVGPLLSVVLWAFAERWRYPALIPTAFTLEYWSATFSRADIGRALPNSIAITLIVTTLSACICLPAAYAFARFRFFGRQIAFLSFLVTNAFPRFSLYLTIAVLFFRLQLIGTVTGIVLMLLINTFIYMIWIPTAAFRSVDRSLEEAALSVGASRLQVFLRVTLPLVFPSLSAALLLTLVSTFYEAEASLIIGLPGVRTLPAIMYPLITQQLVVQYSAVITVATWIPSVLLLIVARRFLSARYLAAGFGV